MFACTSWTFSSSLGKSGQPRAKLRDVALEATRPSVVGQILDAQHLQVLVGVPDVLVQRDELRMVVALLLRRRRTGLLLELRPQSSIALLRLFPGRLGLVVHGHEPLAGPGEAIELQVRRLDVARLDAGLGGLDLGDALQRLGSQRILGRGQGGQREASEHEEKRGEDAVHVGIPVCCLSSVRQLAPLSRKLHRSSQGVPAATPSATISRPMSAPDDIEWPPTLEGQLHSAAALGPAEYGELGVSDASLRKDLAARVVLRVRRSSNEVDEATLAAALAATEAADVGLAAAWQQGADPAWRTYGERFRALVVQAAERQGARGGEVQELADELPGRMIDGPSSPSPLRAYLGRGTLSGWLAVFVRRRVIDRISRRSREVALDDAPPAALPTGTENAEAKLRADEWRRGLEAVALALHDDLTDRERTVLLLRHQQRTTQRSIARALGVGEPRVSRLIQKALAKVGARMQAVFPEGPPEGESDLEPLWRALGGGPGDSRRIDGQGPGVDGDSAQGGAQR